MLSLDRPLSASFGLVLATFAHAVGWPMVRGGAAGVAEALVAELEAAGGELVTGHRVDLLAELPPRVRSCSTSPRASSWRSPATGCRHGAAGEPSGSATARASSRWTGHSTARSRGPPRVRVVPRRSTSAARSTRSPRARQRSPPAVTRSGPTSCSSRIPGSNRPAPSRQGHVTTYCSNHFQNHFPQPAQTSRSVNKRHRSVTQVGALHVHLWYVDLAFRSQALEYVRVRSPRSGRTAHSWGFTTRARAARNRRSSSIVGTC